MNSIIVNGKTVANDIKLVIFDKDGTLIDVHHYWTSMIKIRALEITKKYFNGGNCAKFELGLVDLMGVDMETYKLKPEGPVGVKSRDYIVNIVRDYISKHAQVVSSNDVELLFKEVDAITEKNLLPLLKIMPGVRRLLEKMQQIGVKAVITSTDITSRAIKAMNALGLESYFADIIGGDFVNNTKPAPDLAQLALSKTGFSPENAVVIGDHPVDISMGISAGIDTNIGVLSGISNKELFSKYDCILANNLLEIDVRLNKC
jgi:HAD superfamily hydrolase (TIGR01509 family)